MAPTTELASPRRYALGSSLERIVECTESLSDEELNWRPSAPGANTLGAIALHALANAEENILGTLFGQSVVRDRDAEFTSADVTPATVRARSVEVQTRIREAMARLTLEDLERACQHPRRGMLTGREVQLVAARHAAEHIGEAELTRGLLRASG